MGEETDVKNIEWLKGRVKEEYEDNRAKYNKEGFQGYAISESAFGYVLKLIDQLDEPETLSQEWLVEHSYNVHLLGTPDVETVAIPRDDLQNILVPEQEITKEQVVEWLDNNDFYDHATAETVLANAVDKGEIGYYGTRYAVIEKPTIPKYYAKLKEVQPQEGEWLTNLTGSNFYAVDKRGLMLGEFVLKIVGTKKKASTYTLKDWERHGITEKNADFVKVEETEE